MNWATVAAVIAVLCQLWAGPVAARMEIGRGLAAGAGSFICGADTRGLTRHANGQTPAAPDHKVLCAFCLAAAQSGAATAIHVPAPTALALPAVAEIRAERDVVARPVRAHRSRAPPSLI